MPSTLVSVQVSSMSYSRTHSFALYGAFLTGLTDPPSILLASYNGFISDPILSAEGVKQGDVLSTFLFSYSVQQYYSNSIQGLSDVTASAVVDDINYAGSAPRVLSAFDNLASSAKSSFSVWISARFSGHPLLFRRTLLLNSLVVISL